LIVKELISIFEFQKSIFTNDMGDLKDPLKPFKEGLQRWPPKVPGLNPKNGRIVLPKKPLNTLGTPK
jgi:hypothetical protein